MTAVVDLKQARADKTARVHARIEDAVAELGRDMEIFGEALIEWNLTVKPETKAELAESLAHEIIFRYAPIAERLKPALYDIIELHMAAAAERGEAFDIALLRALTVAMGDERYVEIAKHIARQQLGVSTAGSVVETARDRVFDHYVGLRKK